MIVEALKALRPGANWSLSGDAVSGLVWLDVNQTRPTDAEILATAAALQLPQAKAHLIARVNEDAETCRLAYVTPGAGMAMTYQEKLTQAEAVLTLGESGAAALTAAEIADQFPILSASIGLEAPSLWDCAALVIARYAAFRQIAGQIESARLLGKLAITSAASESDAQAAYDAITWPQP